MKIEVNASTNNANVMVKVDVKGRIDEILHFYFPLVSDFRDYVLALSNYRVRCDTEGYLSISRYPAEWINFDILYYTSELILPMMSSCQYQTPIAAQNAVQAFNDWWLEVGQPVVETLDNIFSGIDITALEQHNAELPIPPAIPPGIEQCSRLVPQAAILVTDGKVYRLQQVNTEDNGNITEQAAKQLSRIRSEYDRLLQGLSQAASDYRARLKRRYEALKEEIAANFLVMPSWAKASDLPSNWKFAIDESGMLRLYIATEYQAKYIKTADGVLFKTANPDDPVPIYLSFVVQEKRLAKPVITWVRNRDGTIGSRFVHYHSMDDGDCVLEDRPLPSEIESVAQVKQFVSSVEAGLQIVILDSIARSRPPGLIYVNELEWFKEETAWHV